MTEDYGSEKIFSWSLGIFAVYVCYKSEYQAVAVAKEGCESGKGSKREWVLRVFEGQRRTRKSTQRIRVDKMGYDLYPS